MLELFSRCFCFGLGVFLIAMALFIAAAGWESKGKVFSYGGPVDVWDWLAGVVAVGMFAVAGYGFLTYACR